ncbi:MAG TPA: aminotransferase class I/II-fold pyridoxal phosphate-dependent enzyme [Methanomassiliicoccaceae archaeon]|jgi:cystathionine gamma-lyase|nr:aminotransferase class I/II-fold pyridoxal phosphate-dependent enzyme [Methanomassiliicoccaceae archaeon]HPP44564.1 aminotransferase class I/II-fold pyridoxal phosphate-dependent enzyme [Methanomassiliicoccaceae archaeon]HPT73992.1 aminotransferase class I/II-fold pyridoxal phosphate-dependent enzyme [Methanomassiliicoccaceae archaeon]HQA21437.1 aminotransferase class I/II-fold pyridoxal phosphate-dependent enzyme [Methanomassiliicoccaceae archaeon]
MAYKGISTKAVHSGERPEPTGAVNTPIYQSSTFRFPTDEPRTWEGEVPEGTYVYSRQSNPTVEVAERKIADLESGKRCLLFSSGMAAISSILMAYLGKGDVMVSQEDIYGGTYNLFRNHLPRLGIDVKWAPSDTEALIDAITPRTKMVWLESPTNPLLRLVDHPEVVRAAHEQGAIVAIDNTFATPVNQRPLESGMDIVMESGTKYLAGHSDLLAGAVVSDGFDISPVHEKRSVLGGSLDPFASFLLERGLKTLPLRMERHNFNGMRIARFLEDHPAVERVHYPGLESHEQHELAKRLLSGFGGMLSFEVKGGRRAAENVMRSLRTIKMATSLGGVESLVSMPLNTSHRPLPPEERARMGITDSMLRLSVGIEDVEDLEADLDQALRAS